MGTNGDDNDNLAIRNNAIDTAYEGIAARATTVLNGHLDAAEHQQQPDRQPQLGQLRDIFRGIEMLDAAAPLITQNEIST